MKNKLLNWIKNHTIDVLEIKTTKQALSSGFVLGTFISLLPFPGFSVIIAVIMIFLFKKISKISIFVAMAIWNPLLQWPIYHLKLSQRLGGLILHSQELAEYSITVLNREYFFSNHYIVGNIIVALVIAKLCGVLFYFLYPQVKKIEIHLPHFIDVLQIKKGEQAIAWGVGLGTFISFLPIPGYSMLIAIVIILCFKQISKIGIIIAMAFWNPITLTPFYFFAYEIGKFFLINIQQEHIFKPLDILNRTYVFTNDFILGLVILLIIMPLLCYFITYQLFNLIKQETLE